MINDLEGKLHRFTSVQTNEIACNTDNLQQQNEYELKLNALNQEINQLNLKVL